MPHDGSPAVSAETSLTRKRRKNSEPLIEHFGGRSQLTQQAVRGLAAALESGGGSSFQQWIDLFRKTCGQDWPRPKARLDRLAGHYGVDFDSARPAMVLFALQTWYVLLVKLLVSHVLARVRGRKSPLCRIAAGDVHRTIVSLAGGRVFRDLKATDPWCGEPFDWIAHCWSTELEEAIRAAAARLAEYDPAEAMRRAAAGTDVLKPLYESLFPRTVRHALGEYYTPGWLAEHVLDCVGYDGDPQLRLLDPTCGSGTFLLAAIRRWREKVVGWDQRAERAPAHRNKSSAPARGGPALADPPTRCAAAPGCPGELVPPYAFPIVGFDLHPLAVASARANYLLAIADLIHADDRVEVPVFARDAILDSQNDAPSFDYVVGNPPWVAWDNLPSDYREATKPLWQHYGLFSLNGNEARHGGGKKDLSMLVLYATADRCLRDGGRLGMVITQTLFQSKGAGDGFRRFRLGAAGAPLKILRVDDLVAARPFGEASNWTSVVALQKGQETVYPLPYVQWTARAKDGVLPSAARRDLLARPIDAAQRTSPWIVGSAARPHPAAAIGRADYTAHLGANSGGANAVYWLEVRGVAGPHVRVGNMVAKAKRAVERVEAVVEPDLLYPLVRWGDVDRWSARPSGYLLLAQDPATRAGVSLERMRRDYPNTLAYLQQFEPLLSTRAAYRRYQERQPFYSMYNVGPYTLAATKVIWRRMDRMIRAAVVETIDDPYLGPRPVVPQETCVLIACSSSDEAHYLCSLLNSSPVHELVSAHSVAGGKGFGTPSILDYLPLKTFDPADEQHAKLATISRRAHAAAREHCPMCIEMAEMDALAAELFKLQSALATPDTR